MVDAYDVMKDKVEQKCEVCAKRNREFDVLFKPTHPFPNTLPIAPGLIRLLGGLVGVMLASPLILASENPWLVAPPFVIGAVTAQIIATWWYQFQATSRRASDTYQTPRIESTE